MRRIVQVAVLVALATAGIAAGAVLVLACVAIVVRHESIPPEAEAVGAGAAEAG